jgi:hypothetical protein
LIERFTIDGAVEFLRVWYELLEPNQRGQIAPRERDFIEAFAAEVVRRVIRDCGSCMATS